MAKTLHDKLAALSGRLSEARDEWETEHTDGIEGSDVLLDELCEVIAILLDHLEDEVAREGIGGRSASRP